MTTWKSYFQGSAKSRVAKSSVITKPTIRCNTLLSSSKSRNPAKRRISKWTMFLSMIAGFMWTSHKVFQSTDGKAKADSKFLMTTPNPTRKDSTRKSLKDAPDQGQETRNEKGQDQETNLEEKDLVPEIMTSIGDDPDHEKIEDKGQDHGTMTSVNGLAQEIGIIIAKDQDLGIANTEGDPDPEIGHAIEIEGIDDNKATFDKIQSKTCSNDGLLFRRISGNTCTTENTSNCVIKKMRRRTAGYEKVPTQEPSEHEAFTPKQFERSCTSSIPWKAIVYAAFLFIVGTVLLLCGLFIHTGHVDNEVKLQC